MVNVTVKPAGAGGVESLVLPLKPDTLKQAIRDWHAIEGQPSLALGKFDATHKPLLEGLATPEAVAAIEAEPDDKKKLALLIVEVVDAAALEVIRFVVGDAASDAQVDAWVGESELSKAEVNAARALLPEELKPGPPAGRKDTWTVDLVAEVREEREAIKKYIDEAYPTTGDLTPPPSRVLSSSTGGDPPHAEHDAEALKNLEEIDETMQANA